MKKKEIMKINVMKFEKNPVIHFHITSTLKSLKLKIGKHSTLTPVEIWVNCEFKKWCTIFTENGCDTVANVLKNGCMKFKSNTATHF